MFAQRQHLRVGFMILAAGKRTVCNMMSLIAQDKL